MSDNGAKRYGFVGQRAIGHTGPIDRKRFDEYDLRHPKRLWHASCFNVKIEARRQRAAAPIG
jgi:hypothetical protein